MSQEVWKMIGDIAINAFYLLCLVFVLLYATLSPWYRTQMGRNIMTLMAALAAIGIYGIYANYLSRKADPEAYAAAVKAAQAVHYPLGFWQIRFFLFAVLAIAVGWRIMIFVKHQILARRETRAKKEQQNHDLRT